jgi:hypothetical protein
MPWSFKATILALVVFACGVALMGGTFFVSGWDSLWYFAWGSVTAGAGLAMGILFSLICGATQPKWRRASFTVCAAAALLLVGLVLFAAAA